MGVLLHVWLCAMCIEEGVWSLRTKVTDYCKLQWGFWELNPSAAEEHSILLTTSHLSSPCFEVDSVYIIQAGHELTSLLPQLPD